MGIFLNPQCDSNNDFIELVNSSEDTVFVDKTKFIGETIKRLNNKTKKFIAFTRPCRFGKTSMAKMLAAYYSKGANSEEFFFSFRYC